MTDVTGPAAAKATLAIGSRELTLALVVGAILGATLVFPSRIPVELTNTSRRTVRLALDGEPPVEVAPLATVTREIRRWHFTRVEYALVPDGGASRGTSSLSPRDFLLFDRLRVRITGTGLELQGS